MRTQPNRGPCHVRASYEHGLAARTTNMEADENVQNGSFPSSLELICALGCAARSPGQPCPKIRCNGRIDHLVISSLGSMGSFLKIYRPCILPGSQEAVTSRAVPIVRRRVPRPIGPSF